MSLKGTFAELPLTDLVEMAALGSKTGRLDVYDDWGAPAGGLSLRDGRVVGATCRELVGERAFYALLAATEGSFVFDPAGDLGEETCDLPADGLLMEAMRRLDEVRRLHRAWPAGTRVRALGSEPEGEVEALALAAIGTSAPEIAELVGALIAGSDADEYEALSALQRLAERGEVVFERGGEAPAAST